MTALRVLLFFFITLFLIFMAYVNDVEKLWDSSLNGGDPYLLQQQKKMDQETAMAKQRRLLAHEHSMINGFNIFDAHLANDGSLYLGGGSRLMKLDSSFVPDENFNKVFYHSKERENIEPFVIQKIITTEDKSILLVNSRLDSYSPNAPKTIIRISSSGEINSEYSSIVNQNLKQEEIGGIIPFRDGSLLVFLREGAIFDKDIFTFKRFKKFKPEGELDNSWHPKKNEKIEPGSRVKIIGNTVITWTPINTKVVSAFEYGNSGNIKWHRNYKYLEAYSTDKNRIKYRVDGRTLQQITIGPQKNLYVVVWDQREKCMEKNRPSWGDCVGSHWQVRFLSLFKLYESKPAELVEMTDCFGRNNSVDLISVDNSDNVTMIGALNRQQNNHCTQSRGWRYSSERQLLSLNSEVIDGFDKILSVLLNRNGKNFLIGKIKPDQVSKTQRFYKIIEL